MGINIESLQSSISKELSNVTPSVSTTSLSEAISSASSSFDNTVASVKSTLGSSLTSAISALEGGLSSFSSSFPDAVSSIFGNSNSSTSALSNATADAEKGQKDVDAKLTSLASDSSTALAEPVSFVTKPIDDAIKGTTTTANGTDLSSGLSNISKSSVSNISKATGTNITSGSDLTSAIKDVTSSLSENIKSAAAEVNDLKTSISEPIVSTVKDITNNLNTGISSTLKYVTEDSGLSTIINSGKELTSTVLDVLPEPIQNFVSSKSSSFLNEATNKLLSSKLGGINSLLNMLPGVSTNDSAVNKLLALSDGTVYSTFTDDGGYSLDSLLGKNNDPNVVSTIYSAAKGICSNIKEPSSNNFSNNKDLYDALLDTASQMGITDLVNQLKACSTAVDDVTVEDEEEEDIAYSTASTVPASVKTTDVDGNIAQDLFDARSVAILKSNVEINTKSGNASCYQAIANAVGTSNMSNPDIDLITLATNMNDDGVERKVFNQLAETYNTSAKKLVTTETASTEALDGRLVSVMSATDTTIIDLAIGEPDRVLSQAVMSAYA